MTTHQLHADAMTVDCPARPKGCSAPAGQPCVNWSANREPHEHPPATRVPHPLRIRAAERAVR